MDTERRRAALARAVAGTADALLVTKPVNARYLTGFTGSAAAVLVLVDGPTVLATDGRYATQAAAESPDVEVTLTRSGAAMLTARARQGGVRRLAVERHHVTVAA